MFKSAFVQLSLTLAMIHTSPSQSDTTLFIAFPMNSGNLWQYRMPPPVLDSTIQEEKSGKDTVFPNGKIYRQFVQGAYGYTDTTGIVYRRQQGNQVFEYSRALGIETLQYDFSKNPGDTVSISPLSTWDTTITIVVTKGTAGFWGTMRHYMGFYTESKHSSLYWFDYIADSIGIYFNQVEPGIQLALLGARIDGVQYGSVTNVVAQSESPPRYFVLLQNYPNPFNSSTIIVFHLMMPARVDIGVWNSLGEKVRSLLSASYDAGSHRVPWDGRGDRGTVLPSGVYFYRMQAGKDQQTRKAYLMR